jgi:hypothetical protein
MLEEFRGKKKLLFKILKDFKLNHNLLSFSICFSFYFLSSLLILSLLSFTILYFFDI